MVRRGSKVMMAKSSRYLSSTKRTPPLTSEGHEVLRDPTNLESNLTYIA